jgi:hypothetical protein
MLLPIVASSAYDGEWVAITPEGFFAASSGGGTLLSVVRGLDVTTIGQVHQSLFNPDLVRETLAGDPDGEVRKAGEVINLDKVIDSGPAPLVEITSHTAKSNTDRITVSARIKDRGKGIGRIEWRINGITVGVANDSGATAGELKRTIARIASEISPRDTFVLFAAAHGTSHNGRFYLIPQDYDGGTNPDALQQRAIGQDLLQDWVANRIKAKKAILLLDTCESGALVGGYSRSRTDVPASEAAIGRLHEATGRPVLTAAATGKPALEGYKGHGVFTWALLDALRNGDTNNNGTIELSELVAHVQALVPKISQEMRGSGRGEPTVPLHLTMIQCTLFLRTYSAV